jgi:hypothetical protein
MKTTFKQVAHLYLGCKCFNFKTSRYTELVHLRIGADLSDMKPILRQLSDMIEEELNHIIQIGEIHYRGESSRDFIVGWKAYAPKTFVYLLKQGFDLFYLIQSGEAIDRTTLPSQAKN